ncbi:hypothetical protein NDU88_001886 [Pleurodeles waltl]|uniref:Uncharacterized protein n=1 Tax=Pleurodeles waltl TaxID=8319 RepID=A0AAV7P773_PLEWA|nr:hypothetical protein NDU88_001886 [Pleurodeles waltl]
MEILSLVAVLVAGIDEHINYLNSLIKRAQKATNDLAPRCCCSATLDELSQLPTILWGVIKELKDRKDAHMPTQPQGGPNTVHGYKYVCEPSQKSSPPGKVAPNSQFLFPLRKNPKTHQGGERSTNEQLNNRANHRHHEHWQHHTPAWTTREKSEDQRDPEVEIAQQKLPQDRMATNLLDIHSDSPRRQHSSNLQQRRLGGSSPSRE